MSTTKKIKELEEKAARIDAQLASVSRNKVNDNTPSKEQVFGTPFVRKGESVMSSRGFQFQRLVGVLSKTIQPEYAKLELDITDRLRQVNAEANFASTPGAISAPMSTDLMGGTGVDDDFRAELKSLCLAGVSGIDRGELEYVARKTYGMKTNQSWVDETLGGALVAPPAFGELITLFRNKDALINAGASVVPLPPSGRIRFPRQTSPSTGYYVGENAAITGSTVGTGSLILSAKKVAALVTLPSELIRFASPASEALLRADMTKTLSLTMDYYLLYGDGSDNVPLGLVNTPGIATVTPTTTGADGNTLSPQDLFKFCAAVEANNAEFQGWILRPETFYAFCQARAGVYNGSAVVANGQFVYDQFRALSQGFPKNLAGYPATTTAQVSITRAKGSASNLTTVFGGMWSDYLIAMFGSIELMSSPYGDNTFAQDQIQVRAILSHDGGARHPGGFAVADQVFQTTLGA